MGWSKKLSNDDIRLHYMLLQGLLPVAPASTRSRRRSAGKPDSGGWTNGTAMQHLHSLPSQLEARQGCIRLLHLGSSTLQGCVDSQEQLMTTSQQWKWMKHRISHRHQGIQLQQHCSGSLCICGILHKSEWPADPVCPDNKTNTKQTLS